MKAEQLRNQIRSHQEQVASAEAELADLARNCTDRRSHDWGEVKFDPIHREGYVIPSDLDRGIYLGVDTRVSRIYVDPETIKEWVRTCKKCGTDQRTRRTKEVAKPGSVPGTTATEQVPDFGS